jgi:hypothetical protein
LQAINALIYAAGIYLLTTIIALFVGVIIVIIDRASADPIKRAVKQ